jgi:hypothetical protein
MNFEIAIQLLVDSGVQFVVIGGWSAILHGSRQVTNDLDLCYSRERANLNLLADTLAPYHPRPRGFPSDLPFVWDSATLSNSSILTLTTDLGLIDLIAEVPGIGAYADALQHSVTAEAFGRVIRTLDLPSLIRAKKASGRPKDLFLLPELESILGTNENQD